MTTSVPTVTAPIRGACRHDTTTATTTSTNTSTTTSTTATATAMTRVATTVRALPGDGRGVAGDDIPGTGTPWPIIDLSDLLTGVSDVPCQENDAELWFAESPEDVEFAKSLCGTCPARATCLQGALARREPWGVWGGELFVMGQVVPRKRPRGRPRKDAVA